MKNCPSCGVLNDDDSKSCDKCGRSLPKVEPLSHAHIDDYLVPAILGTIFCCLPFGIVSIVYAAQVGGFIRSGNIREAQITAEKAKSWFWISFWCGMAAVLLTVLAKACSGAS